MVAINMLMVMADRSPMQPRRAPASSRSSGTIDPDQHLSYVMAKVSHQLELAIGRALSSRGITVTQFSALAHIARSPGLSSADLARALLTTPQATATLVRRLIDAELVQRPDVAPGLASALRLTTRGLRKLTGAERIATEAEEQALSTLSPTEQRRLAATLGNLAAALERD
jgi:DNA-binding MarR family transcriptional regulator